MKKITKAEAIAAAGGTAAALARLLGVRHQAVQQWPADEPIPDLRQYQMREKFPQLFEDLASEARSSEARAA